MDIDSAPPATATLAAPVATCPAAYSTACRPEPHLVRAAMTEAMPPKVWEQKLAEVPMQRAGEPEEIALVAPFYASDLSSCMTGTVAEVTGGRYM